MRQGPAGGNRPAGPRRRLSGHCPDRSQPRHSPPGGSAAGSRCRGRMRCCPLLSAVGLCAALSAAVAWLAARRARGGRRAMQHWRRRQCGVPGWRRLSGVTRPCWGREAPAARAGCEGLQRQALDGGCGGCRTAMQEQTARAARMQAVAELVALYRARRVRATRSQLHSSCAQTRLSRSPRAERFLLYARTRPQLPCEARPHGDTIDPTSIDHIRPLRPCYTDLRS